MNILYIVHDNKKGGAAISFLEMINLVKDKHRVYVITPHKKGYLPEELSKLGVWHNNAHYFWWKIALPKNQLGAWCKKRIYKILNLWNYIEAWRTSFYIKKMGIDMIHSNSSVINFGGLLAKKLKCPHIWHLREYGEEDFNLNLVVNEKKYRREFREQADGYIAISKSIEEKFSTIIERQKIYQIYNGVSDSFCYKKGIEEHSSKSIRFLISGNYCREKGQTDVIEAVSLLNEMGITKFELLVAGAGSFEEPRKMVKEKHLEKLVHFCGCVNDMVQLRKETDVEIVASKCEAFGRVTVEAMRMSNPVIVTNSGGSSELVEAGVNGFLFSYGNVKELAEYMRTLIENHQLLIEMGYNAYRETAEKYTSYQNAEKIMNLYKVIKGNANFYE